MKVLDFESKGVAELLPLLEDHVVRHAILFIIVFSNYFGKRSRTEAMTLSSLDGWTYIWSGLLNSSNER